MGRKLKVDWMEIKTVCNDFEENAKEVTNIKKELIEVINTLESSWKGTDSGNFKVSTEKMANELDEEVEYLQEWSNYIENASSGYSDTFNNHLSRLQNLNNDFSNFNIR